MTLNRGESWLSRIAHEWSDAVHGMPARYARIVRTIDSPGRFGIPTGSSKTLFAGSVGKVSPRSHAHTGRVKPA